MTRDMDYIRKLLLEIEAAPPEQPWSTESEFETPRNAQLYRTLELLQGAGYVRVAHRSVYHGGGELWNDVTLTMAGFDFLDNIRNPRVWEATKKQISTTVGTASLEIFAQVAASFVKKLLNLPG